MRRHVWAWVLSLGLLGGAAQAADARKVDVFAAASLTEAFKAIGAEFTRAHPGVDVEFNFAGSPTLVQQIQQGAPADVFASADEVNMGKLEGTGEVTVPSRIFAGNRLAIIVAPGNPRRITGLADLANPGLVVVLCGPTVPAGRYARQAFEKAGVKPPEGSQELDVKAVVTKVTLGEADAGVVYTTDVRAAGEKAAGVAIPPELNVEARYPIAVVKEADAPTEARQFVDFVLSPAGRQVLERFGFTGP